MQQSSVLFALLGAAVLAGLLSACNSGSPSASASAGGASGSGSASASGTVTGFGSLFVNGKKFETDDVEVRHDGITERCAISSSVGQRCGLKEGMTVKVSGTFSGLSHRATTIIQEDTVEGPITSVDIVNSQFAVLGQTVLVDDTTKFDSGISLATLAVNDVVEVGGFVKSDGVIVASFVERKSGAGCGADGCEVKGVVTGHAHNNGTASGVLQIGGLTVVYDNATLINDMPVPTGSNWNGMFVEVKGTSFDAATTTLTATKVEPENEGAGDVVDEFEVEGFVTQAGTPAGNIIEFTIGTIPVRTTANTEFRGGTVDEIVVGAKMSAEGRFDGNTLIAKHVKFHESVKLEGNATVTGNTLTLAGLPGVTIAVNSLTELEDSGNIITLNDLDGNHVRVRGRVSGANSVIATRIELRSPDNDVDLQGPVQAVSDPTVTILGVTVDTTGVTQFEGIDDGPMNRAAFFAAVQVGTLVKVKGTWNGTAVTWEEAELED